MFLFARLTNHTTKSNISPPSSVFMIHTPRLEIVVKAKILDSCGLNLAFEQRVILVEFIS